SIVAISRFACLCAHRQYRIGHREGLQNAPADRPSRQAFAAVPPAFREALHAAPQGEMNASPRTSGLFADRSSAAASGPGRNPLGCGATGSARRVGFVASDGTDGDLAAPRPAAITRPTELELARIRHAGRVLAAEENARAPGRLADGHAE